MKTIKVTSDTFPVLSVSTYGGYFDTEYTLERDLDELPEKLCEQYWDSFDNGKYMQAVAELADDTLQSSFDREHGELGDLKVYGVTEIKGSKIVSPREYNFATDQLDIDITMHDNTPELVANKLEQLNQKDDTFAKYLKDNFTSYDGFMSFVTNDVQEFIAQVYAGDDRELALALFYLLVHEHDYNVEDIQAEMLENGIGNGYLSATEFCSDKVADKILKVYQANN